MINREFGINRNSNERKAPGIHPWFVYSIRSSGDDTKSGKSDLSLRVRFRARQEKALLAIDFMMEKVWGNWRIPSRSRVLSSVCVGVEEG